MLNFQKNISLKKYATFKIGGNARYFFEAKNENDFVEAILLAEEQCIPYSILAGGSNILISDNGFNGLVTRYSFSENPKVEGDEIICGAGTSLSSLVNFSVGLELSGLEWAVGIPGTLGGAIRGNAGAYDGEMSSIVEEVKMLNKNREISILKNSEINFRYRDSIFKEEPHIILSATLKLKKDKKKKIKNRIQIIFEKRKKSLGMLWHPSAGCVFKNPQTEDQDLLQNFRREKGAEANNNRIPAGYLIEKAGLKGFQFGGAVVSSNNANFIFNLGNAKSSDVVNLISLIKQEVKEKFSIILEEEISYLGQLHHKSQ